MQQLQSYSNYKAKKNIKLLKLQQPLRNYNKKVKV